jgi:hypothetical protein
MRACSELPKSSQEAHPPAAELLQSKGNLDGMRNLALSITTATHIYGGKHKQVPILIEAT